MKKFYLYTGIGAWVTLLFFIIVLVAIVPDSSDESNTQNTKFQMQEVATHEIIDDQSIAVKITKAHLILDSKAPQSCILGDCFDDRPPGKYRLTVVMDITNLSNDAYNDNTSLFKIKDANGKTYDNVISTDLGSLLLDLSLSKGQTIQEMIIYDIDPPMSKYTLVLKQHWSEKETLILLNEVQKLRPVLCEGDAVCFGGFIKDVLDGNTVNIINIESGNLKQIHLALVNTPSVGDANYANAKDFLSGFCPVNSYVLFDEDDGQPRDNATETVHTGKLFCDGKSVNKRLLEHDLAVIDSESCAISEYANQTWPKSYDCN